MPGDYTFSLLMLYVDGNHLNIADPCLSPLHCVKLTVPNVTHTQTYNLYMSVYESIVLFWFWILRSLCKMSLIFRHI